MLAKHLLHYFYPKLPSLMPCPSSAMATSMQEWISLSLLTEAYPQCSAPDRLLSSTLVAFKKGLGPNCPSTLTHPCSGRDWGPRSVTWLLLGEAVSVEWG